MTEFKRFAIYYLCPPGPLADFGAAWLGHDIVTGRAVPHPDLPGLPAHVDQITATPRKYGFHGTIKPPFRLAEGCSAADLEKAAETLCAACVPVTQPGLALSRLGSFLALTATGDTAPLSALAAAIVEGLDRFRAPPGEAERARRRARGLSPRQDQNLARWGYPYVMDDFRFHMTLSGRLPPQDAAALEDMLAPRLAPMLPAPFRITDLALVGADDSDYFRLIRRLPLGG